jgi:hypothetical protein
MAELMALEKGDRRHRIGLIQGWKEREEHPSGDGEEFPRGNRLKEPPCFSLIGKIK